MSIKNFPFRCYKITIRLVKMSLALKKINVCETFFDETVAKLANVCRLAYWITLSNIFTPAF